MDTSRRRPTGILAALGALALLAGCPTPVGVHPVDAQAVHRYLTRNVLSSGEPSARSLQVLHRLDLRQRFASQPEAVLAELHAGLEPTGDPDRVFALAELSYLHAEQGGGRSHYRAAAVYAYAYLFPHGDATPPLSIDPTYRLASDLYNRGLTEGLIDEPGTVELRGQSLPLPFGTLDITAYRRDFEWGRYRMVGFYPVAALEVRGLRNRYRRPGIGAPLGADVDDLEGAKIDPAAFRRVPDDVKVPVTAFLRIDRPRRQIARGAVAATIEIYTSEDPATVRVGGQELPLERESSSALAFTLGQASFAGFELTAFFGRDRLAQGQELLMLRPHRRGRIPVVLVHGTASSPSWWADLLNELQNDPALKDRYEFWLFRYDTGNPILYSGGLLTKTLRETVAELDPRGEDAALRSMVVIGHSQGGLLTKLAVVDSGNAFWSQVSDTPLEQLDLDPDQRELLRRSFFYEPLPFVRSVVFMATPHGGSFLATPFLARLLRGIVELPFDLVTLPLLAAQRLDNSPEARLARRLDDQATTSIDSMTPGSHFVTTLAGLAIDPGVEAHSIIAVQTQGPVEEGNDGVVKYRSARLEGVSSERVIRSGHSVQGHPLAIAEIARILDEHARAR